MSQKRSRRQYEADQAKQNAPYVVYGTPLPPLDDHARDDGSYVPLWKQEVLDESGRKRLHGAFTGGFSAGYFNTVGSKEGWTPSTFVSSRANRAKDGKVSAQQRPEDFMDEEDLREQEESKVISLTSGQAGFGTAEDPGQRNRLLDIFQPREDSVGIKLLKRMGWKEGSVIGQHPPLGTDPVNDNFLNSAGVRRGKGLHGLGHGDEALRPGTTFQKDENQAGDHARPGLSFAGIPQKKKKHPRPRVGIGIGTGSLDDVGSDDEDVYSIGPKISHNKLNAERRTTKSKHTATSNANPLIKTQPVLISKKLPSSLNSLRKCHDGRLPLDGFVLADHLYDFSTMSISDDETKPPEVPEDWEPANLAQKQPLTDNNGHKDSVSSSTSNQFSIKARAQTLGENPLPSKSVFDYLSPSARERLVAATGRVDLPPARNEAPNLPVAAPSADGHCAERDDVPSLDPMTAKAALSRDFIPYSDDLEKQSRYKAFLESSSEPGGDATIPSQPTAYSRQEYLAELYEFARAAQVFKPVSGLMASRFTSSSSTTQNSTGTDDPTDTAELLSKPATRPTDPAEEAARVGMFGIATRTVSGFYPTKLVCKRFGVDMPNMQGASN